MSRERMKKDFERLAKERLEVFVEDIYSLHAMADLEEGDAARAVLLALFTTAGRVMATCGPMPSRDEIYQLVDTLLRFETKRREARSKS